MRNSNSDKAVRCWGKKYCSRTCQSIGQLTRKISVCTWCGKEFERKKSEIDRGQKYCSKSCYGASRRKVSLESSKIKKIALNVISAIEYRRIKRICPEVDAIKAISIKAAKYFKPRYCLFCGAHYFTRDARVRKFCSPSCRRLNTAKNRQEYRAGEVFKRLRREHKAKRRAAEKGLESEQIDPLAVFERDNWRCHMCGQKTVKEWRGGLRSLSPELDHIVTLSEGGLHKWDNVACSCRRCNGIKGGSSFGQIVMFGEM